jgi:hypothetical protein
MAAATKARPKETPVPGRPYPKGLIRRFRAKQRSLFRDQYAEAMEILDRAAGRKILGQLEPDWRNMFTPHKLKLWADESEDDIEDGWEIGARQGLLDINNELGELRQTVRVQPWDIEAPGARQSIQRAALDLSHTANGVTQRQMESLLPRLRGALIDGTAKGDGYDFMAEQIRQLFGHANKYRAETIAITETQRAVHQGLLHQYQESGVVEATEWLTSGAPCPLCVAVASEHEQGVALFQEYARQGRNATYSSVNAPPLHPRCLCSLFPILIPVEQMPRMAA